MTVALALALPPALMWIGLLLAPWRPWSTREHIEADSSNASFDLSAVTVLIPARNEADVIDKTLSGLQAQGQGLHIIVVNDQSTDATAQIAAAYPNVRVISGQPLPEGWAGKLWALEQGKAHVQTTLTLLLDADIQLQPGLLAALLALKQKQSRHFVSVMANLHRSQNFWDALLLPLFVYYFKLLYPFALSNSRFRYVAAAAGGCILVDTQALQRVGAFSSLRNALIDDCTLARQIKNAGFSTWMGLSRDVISLRPYGTLRSIHDMVARSAFTQLNYSTALLLVVTLLFALLYWIPLALLCSHAWLWALIAWLAMTISYLPTLRYYGISLFWVLLLPFGATLYLGMTWSSAIRYWRGVRSRWKGRTYNT